MQKEAYENISTSQNDPIMEWRTCEISGDEFPIYQGDIDLLTKLYPTIGSATFDLPLPTLAPRVRELMSLMYKNERNLYHITSSLSSESTVSRIAPEM